jgi:hypothetical protein
VDLSAKAELPHAKRVRVPSWNVVRLDDQHATPALREERCDCQPRHSSADHDVVVVAQVSLLATECLIPALAPHPNLTASGLPPFLFNTL